MSDETRLIRLSGPEAKRLQRIVGAHDDLLGADLLRSIASRYEDAERLQEGVPTFSSARCPVIAGRVPWC